MTLIERIEAASGPDYDLLVDIAQWAQDNRIPLECYGNEPINYDVRLWLERHGWDPTASIDAAMGLLPDRATTALAMQDRHSLRWKWEVRTFEAVRHRSSGNTPALAVCAAALRARGME